MFGGKVEFGFKSMYAYAREKSGLMLTRTKFLIVLLLPAIIIALISLIIPQRIVEVVFLLNTLGSVGDIIMAIYLCKVDDNSYILDGKYGFDVIKK